MKLSQDKWPGFEKPWPPAALCALIPVIALLTGCVTTDTGATDVSCLVFEPVRWSLNDTAETISQIKAHNAAWKSVCGK